MIRSYLLLIAALAFLASCEKAEDPIVLPQPGTARHSTVELGKDYNQQVYFDLETGESVFSSDYRDWDLAFEASSSGRHVFINGGNEVFAYNTQKTSWSEVVSLPSGLSATGFMGWQYDAPNGLPTETAVGDWWQTGGSSMGHIYLVQTTTGINKFRIVSADDRSYKIEWLPLSETNNARQVELQKDSNYNYVYFSFVKGSLALEPRKDSWDIQFTRCRDTIYETAHQLMLPYVVTGALTNPYQTLAGADSVSDFSAIDLAKAQAMDLNNNRMTIGYDWKQWSFGNSSYEVNRRKNYVVKTRKDQLYKLRFLGFYNSGGQKGNPSFEYERLR